MYMSRVSHLLLPLCVRAIALAPVAEGAIECARGAAYGYVGLGSFYFCIDTLGAIASSPSRRKKNNKQVAAPTISDATSVKGRWLLDVERSESLEPFLIAVGAPKLIAKMVGKKGKPMTIHIDGQTVTVSIEGKETETFFSNGRPSTVDTPRGKVTAMLKGGNPWRKFVVSKAGPLEGESTREERELIDDGRTLRCTFTHTSDEGIVTRVIRYYTRS